MSLSPPKSRWRWLGPVASAVVFLASIAVLWFILSEIDTAEVLAALASKSREQLAYAAAFAALSYLLLIGYDAIGLRQLGLKLPFRTTALGSYTSFAISFTLGFPLVTAGTVRYWIYARKGVRPAEVAKLTVIVGLTFWLGMAVALGAALLHAPAAIAPLARTTPLIVQAAGAGLVLMVVAYLAWVAGGRRGMEVRGWRLELPGARLSILQILIGAAEVCAASAVLYLLLPAGHGVPFEAFLAVYVFAAAVGIVSHLPGGVGAFEATMLVGLAQVPAEQLIGALLLFRLIYYVAPFILALMLLGLYEVAQRLKARPL